MDFWGFESRGELPGDGFGMFQTAGKVADAGGAPRAADAGATPDSGSVGAAAAKKGAPAATTPVAADAGVGVDTARQEETEPATPPAAPAPKPAPSKDAGKAKATAVPAAARKAPPASDSFDTTKIKEGAQGDEEARRGYEKAFSKAQEKIERELRGFDGEGFYFKATNREGAEQEIAKAREKLEGQLTKATGTEADEKNSKIKAQLARLDEIKEKIDPIYKRQEGVTDAAEAAKERDFAGASRSLKEMSDGEQKSQKGETSRSGEPGEGYLVQGPDGKMWKITSQASSGGMPDWVKNPGQFWGPVLGHLSGYGTAQNMVNAITGAPVNSAFGFNYADPTGSGSFGSGPYGSPGFFGGPGYAGAPYGGVSGGYGFGSVNGGIDLSNNGFYIGQQSGENEAKSRHLDALINYLLMAIGQGNVDMIETAITICNLKAKTTLIHAAKNVIEAMRLYDRNMKVISDEMGKLAGKKQEDQGAGLASLNAKMNEYSMVRQAITNTLRDIMAMNEEMSSLENAIYTKKDHEAQFYRWA